VRGFAIAVFCSVLTASAAADAAPATLAAIAPAGDVRKAVAIGPTGQLYEPDGKGAWVRRRAGGTSENITGAIAVGGNGTVIATAKNSNPFKLTKTGTWSAIVIAPKEKPIMGTGTRVLAAMGKKVFAFDTTAAEPTKLADVPSPVIAIAASRSRAIAVTPKGLYELQGASWKQIKKAPKTVRSLVSDRWAIVDRGVLDLKTLQTIAWPAGVRVDETAAVGDTLYAVAAKGKSRELLTLSPRAAAKAKAAKGAKAAPAAAAAFDREEIPLASSVAIVGVVADEGKRVAVATRDGKVAVRAGGTWTTAEVTDELPAAKPGPAPALSVAP